MKNSSLAHPLILPLVCGLPNKQAASFISKNAVWVVKAISNQRMLVTRNNKDFPPTDRSVRIPYSL